MVATQAVLGGAKLQMAEAVFARGTDYFGPGQIKLVHGEFHVLDMPEALPDIPWSKEELRQARAAGAHLILVVPNLTMKQLVEARKNLVTDGGKLLCQIDWYKNEPLYTTATTAGEWHWRLVEDEVIPGSIGKNHLEQTALIAERLKEIFASRDLLQAYQRAIAEFEQKREKIAKLVNINWQEAAKQLSELQLNQLCRESPVLTLYRLITYEAVNHVRLLQGVYHWTSSLSLRGYLVGVGGFGRGGAGVGGWFPGISSGATGVALSRSSLAEVEGGW